MQYDFDKMTDRSGTYSMKWNVEEGELPMWVADMDFETAPPIVEALKERVSHGIFGYTEVPDAWAKAYVDWWERRHHFTMQEDWLIYTTGIVPAISSMVRKLTTPNENVLILTPVYNIFFNSIINNGARVLECPLLEVGDGYEISWEALEEGLANPQTSLMIFCNPHNPVGKIWDRASLKRVGELACKYGVTVISDEIHCDLTDPGKEYIPFASVSDQCRDCSITCIAPTKTFNIAGLNSAAVSIPNPFLRHKVWRGLNTDEVAEPGAFAMAATLAAFEKGEPWLLELQEYLYGNKLFVQEFMKENLPMVGMTGEEATYLLWLNVKSYLREDGCRNVEELTEFIRRETGLIVTAGSEYGQAGEGFLRLNIACPRERLKDGLHRLKKGLTAAAK